MCEMYVWCMYYGICDICMVYMCVCMYMYVMCMYGWCVCVVCGYGVYVCVVYVYSLYACVVCMYGYMCVRMYMCICVEKIRVERVVEIGTHKIAKSLATSTLLPRQGTRPLS